jgi:hypothetical protein
LTAGATRATPGDIDQLEVFMISARGALRVGLVFVMLLTTLLFGVGTSLERSQHEEHPNAATSHEEPSGDDDHAEAPASREASEVTNADKHEEGGSGPAVGENEEIFGLNPESTRLIAIGIAISLLLAIAVWLTQRWEVLAAVLVVMLGFAALDAREALHQLNEDNADIASIAIVVTLLHVTAATLAAILLKRSGPRLSGA